MNYFFLTTGILIAAFAIAKYMRLQQREGKDYKLVGLNISEEVIWIILFVLGIIFIISYLIGTLEPFFLNRGM